MSEEDLVDLSQVGYGKLGPAQKGIEINKE